MSKENKMGTMPIGPLLMNMSIPMMISMLVQALYNIVDSAFVGMISSQALAAVSLAFVYQNLCIALGIGTGVGVNALVARYLGEKDRHKASQVANVGIKLALITSVVFCGLTLLSVGPYFSSLSGKNNDLSAATIQAGKEYIIICCGIPFGVFVQTMLEKLLQATGKTKLSMVSQMSGAIFNCIMDPLWIFGIGPFPKMGVAGAALATVSGQFLGAGIALYFNIRYNNEIEISWKKYRMDFPTVRSIYGISLPTIIMQAVGSVMYYGFSRIVVRFTEDAVTVFGSYFKLQSFVFMPIFGLNNGMIPIVGYNYGARRPERIRKVVHMATLVAVGIMAVGTLIFLCFPRQLLGIFSVNEQILAIGIPALRIISVHFCIAGFCIVSNSFFQAMGHGMLSLFVSVGRQIVILLPAAYILSLVGGLSVVWWAFPIAELASATMCTLFRRRVDRLEIAPLEKGRAE
ncbi:putative efflux protein, MATE family [Lachnospiraceae bacterium C10]|nr:putative efflux protein, MATE family [Lachnospiraceae bacterium C10]